MSLITEVLGQTLKNKFLGSNPEEVSSPIQDKKSLANIQIIGKQFMYLKGIARDLNVASLNVQKMVERLGGKPRESGQTDMHILKPDELGRKLEVDLEKEMQKPELVPAKKEEEKKPTLIQKGIKKLKESKLGKKVIGEYDRIKQDLMAKFDIKNLVKSFQKYFAIATIVGVVIYSFKDSIAKFATELWESITQGFNEFVEGVKNWFDEVVQPILEDIKSFFDEWVTKPVKTAFDFIVNMFKGVFETWYGLITSPFETVKRIWDKVMGGIMSLLDKVPDWIKEKLGLPKKIEQKPVDAVTEKQKVEKQKEEETRKLVADKEKVAKLEKEKQYTGRDEIVRERLGLPSVSAADMPTEPLLVPPPSVTPSPKPSAAPSPAPTPKAAEVPSITPSAAKAEPAAAVPKPSQTVSGMEDVKKMVIKHEGIRNKPYKDSLGLWTVGVGHLIGDGKTLPPEWNRTFTDQEVMNLFEEDFAHHVKIAEQTPGYQKANQGGKGAFIDLAFNMGKWWPKWPTTKKKLQEGDFQAAAQGLQDSKWYQQVKGRAKTIVGLVAQAGEGAGNGGTIASESTSIASSQRQQMKPSSPIVVNTPTTNSTVIQHNTPPIIAKSKVDSGKMMMNRVT